MKRDISLLGWYGVLAILAAYALVTFSIVSPHNYPYQILNLTGAICLFIEAYSKKDYQPATLNVIWSLIALIALIRIAIS